MKKIIIAFTIAAVAAVVAVCSPVRSMLGADGAETTTEDWTPTAADYICDTMNWDAIENAGYGLHDPDATTWTELISGDSCTLTGTIGVDFDWGEDSFLRKAENRGYFVYDATERLQETFRNATFTIEILTSSPIASANWQAQIFNVCKTSQVPYYSMGIIARYRREDTGYSGSVSGNTYPSGPSFRIPDTSDYTSFAVTYENGSGTMYVNGVPSGTVSATPDASINGVHVRLGSTSYGFRGQYHALRISSRALSSEEIKYNHLIDRLRFNLQ